MQMQEDTSEQTKRETYEDSLAMRYTTLTLLLLLSPSLPQRRDGMVYSMLTSLSCVMSLLCTTQDSMHCLPWRHTRNWEGGLVRDADLVCGMSTSDLQKALCRIVLIYLGWWNATRVFWEQRWFLSHFTHYFPQCMKQWNSPGFTGLQFSGSVSPGGMFSLRTMLQRGKGTSSFPVV